MALNETQQAVEAINRATSILVVSRAHPTPDAVASVTACAAFLRGLGKTVEMLIPGFEPEKAPGFLHGAEQITGELGPMRNLRISVDLSKVPLHEFSYDVQGDTLEITLIPKKGEWKPEHISHTHDHDRFDVIIAVDCPDLQSLGELTKTHSELLHRIPIINIDAAPENEHWGQINIVDLSAVATTEILHSFFEPWKASVDPDLATCLLTGIISKTRSFQHGNVTPQVLAKTSALIECGADREKIMRGLWRTKKTKALRLWGTVLSRLDFDEVTQFAWSKIRAEDFLNTSTTPHELEAMLDTLLLHAPDAKVIALVFQEKEAEELRVILHTKPPFSARELAGILGGDGTKYRADMAIQGTTQITDADEKVIVPLQKHLRALTK